MASLVPRTKNSPPMSLFFPSRVFLVATERKRSVLGITKETTHVSIEAADRKRAAQGNI